MTKPKKIKITKVPKIDTQIKDRDGKPIFTGNKLRDNDGNEYMVLEKRGGGFQLSLVRGSFESSGGAKSEFTDGSGYRNITFNW